jgi:hypothetical protein
MTTFCSLSPRGDVSLDKQKAHTAYPNHPPGTNKRHTAKTVQSPFLEAKTDKTGVLGYSSARQKRIRGSYQC